MAPDVLVVVVTLGATTTRWTAYDRLSAVLDFDGTGALAARYVLGLAVDRYFYAIPL
jgi:hypothetical protein